MRAKVNRTLDLQMTVATRPTDYAERGVRCHRAGRRRRPTGRIRYGSTPTGTPHHGTAWSRLGSANSPRLMPSSSAATPAHDTRWKTHAVAGPIAGRRGQLVVDHAAHVDDRIGRRACHLSGERVDSRDVNRHDVIPIRYGSRFGYRTRQPPPWLPPSRLNRHPEPRARRRLPPARLPPPDRPVASRPARARVSRTGTRPLACSRAARRRVQPPGPGDDEEPARRRRSG